MNLSIIHWNIGYNAVPNKIVKELKSHISDSFIIVLLEVTPKKYAMICDQLKDVANILYSLHYRQPGKFDSKNRKLGVVILTSKNINVLDSGVFMRTLFPERTLFAEIELEGRKLKIVGLHSITGCDYKKAKAVNFLSFAEMVEDYKPDVIAIDANEPDIDHYDIQQMKFYDKRNGKGASVFFKTMIKNGLSDCFTIHYDINQYVKGEPLAISHIIKGNKNKKRYDFVFVNQKSLQINSAIYDYDAAVAASADHAIVAVDACL